VPRNTENVCGCLKIRPRSPNDIQLHLLRGDALLPSPVTKEILNRRSVLKDHQGSEMNGIQALRAMAS
jgi:hypothetical protein